MSSTFHKYKFNVSAAHQASTSGTGHTTRHHRAAHSSNNAATNSGGGSERIEWSRATILGFIEDYRCQRVLWDPNTKGYHIKQTKYEALKALGHKYGTEIRSIRSKIKSLRSSFHREHGKVINGRRKGIHYQPMWFAYEAIRFILDGETHQPQLQQQQQQQQLTPPPVLQQQQQQQQIKGEDSHATAKHERQDCDDDGESASASGANGSGGGDGNGNDVGGNGGRPVMKLSNGSSSSSGDGDADVDADGDGATDEMDVVGAEVANAGDYLRRAVERAAAVAALKSALNAKTAAIKSDASATASTTSTITGTTNTKTTTTMSIGNTNTSTTNAVATTITTTTMVNAAAAIAAVAAANVSAIRPMAASTTMATIHTSSCAPNELNVTTSTAAAAAAAAARSDFDGDMQTYCNISADDVKTEIIEGDTTDAHDLSLPPMLNMIERPTTTAGLLPLPFYARAREPDPLAATVVAASVATAAAMTAPYVASRKRKSQAPQYMPPHIDEAPSTSKQLQTQPPATHSYPLNRQRELSLAIGGQAAMPTAKNSGVSGGVGGGGGGGGGAIGGQADEYGVFGEYVAITIRKLKTSKAKIVVKHLINNLLYEAELGKYDHGIPACKEPPQLYKM